MESDFAEYDRTKGFKNLKGILKQSMIKEIKLKQIMQNMMKRKRSLKGLGITKITTSEKYILQGEDIIIDNIENSISSNKKIVFS